MDPKPSKPQFKFNFPPFPCRLPGSLTSAVYVLVSCYADIPAQNGPDRLGNNAHRREQKAALFPGRIRVDFERRTQVAAAPRNQRDDMLADSAGLHHLFDCALPLSGRTQRDRRPASRDPLLVDISDPTLSFAQLRGGTSAQTKKAMGLTMTTAAAACDDRDGPSGVMRNGSPAGAANAKKRAWEAAPQAEKPAKWPRAAAAAAVANDVEKKRSGYRGVSWSYFDGEEEAARAYDVAARASGLLDLPTESAAALNFPSAAERKRSGAEKPRSDYRGVQWDKCTGKWRVQITVDGNRQHVGKFDDEEDAARAAAAVAAADADEEAAESVAAGRLAAGGKTSFLLLQRIEADFRGIWCAPPTMEKFRCAAGMFGFTSDKSRC